MTINRYGLHTFGAIADGLRGATEFLERNGTPLDEMQACSVTVSLGHFAPGEFEALEAVIGGELRRDGGYTHIARGFGPVVLTAQASTTEIDNTGAYARIIARRHPTEDLAFTVVEMPDDQFAGDWAIVDRDGRVVGRALTRADADARAAARNITAIDAGTEAVAA